MEPLVNQEFVLEKFQGKGAWTYAMIPQIPQDKKQAFGWKRVKGSIDGYEIAKYHLMPMGNGNLFLPVKAEIRKKIGKKEGDFVHIILYPDSDPIEVPEEMYLCMQDEPDALLFFNSLSQSEQKYYVHWIYSAKKEETKIDRLAKTINRLLKKLKMHDKIAEEL
jgi:hypothetical protein